MKYPQTGELRVYLVGFVAGSSEHTGELCPRRVSRAQKVAWIKGWVE